MLSGRQRRVRPRSDACSITLSSLESSPTLTAELRSPKLQAILVTISMKIRETPSPGMRIPTAVGIAVKSNA
ncbi:hypothetical protein CVT25_000359 [Psilocybe cyanescens]|uniref:Uncharacterized protein n=1 Tax=Psilocybe cyanescens TaxID=93625 RepID=A0A409X3J2_PSICY|nr:hypothetical protein CVT25_000359 [Psilocybe cyanescens]